MARVLAAFAVAAAVVLGVAGCDDTSDYDTDDYGDTSTPPTYDDDSYDYDDTPDGRFNPSPPQGPYAP